LPINNTAYHQLIAELSNKDVTLVAVSKTKPIGDILELYELGHRDFGENYVQELVDKASQLPKDIHWHYIGHLQTNKVKLIAPFVQLIHGVDSLKLLKEIDKQAEKAGRVIDCLLQVHISGEETKFGLDENELAELVRVYDEEKMQHVKLTGLMGMASFTDDMEKVRAEFKILKELFNFYSGITFVTPGESKGHSSRMSTLSMGMSSDYKTAIEEGSTMVRIGGLLFGERDVKK
jgi:pyridoxal phosphate enzyme (YggS family)